MSVAVGLAKQDPVGWLNHSPGVGVKPTRQPEVAAISLKKLNGNLNACRRRRRRGC